MKFLRFSNTDSNYSTTGHTHIWDLPLSLEHRKVGLSSFSLSIANDVESLKEEVLEFVIRQGIITNAITLNK